ncbi:MAG TPA: hypothetical protein VFG86_26835 [Chloroflexota bacterium]|nr:hypothetical protein [Chloroflexota bacterium]
MAMPFVWRGLAVFGALCLLAGHPIVAAQDDPNAAVRQAIQRSNDALVQAVAMRDLSVMAETATDDYFKVIAGTVQDMLNSSVTSVSLLNLDWGPIVVAADGTSATVTTYETWRVNSQAGTIDYDPLRNDYTLVFENGIWKIKSDVQGGAPAPAATVVPTTTPSIAANYA